MLIYRFYLDDSLELLFQSIFLSFVRCLNRIWIISVLFGWRCTNKRKIPFEAAMLSGIFLSLSSQFTFAPPSTNNSKICSFFSSSNEANWQNYFSLSCFCIDYFTKLPLAATCKAVVFNLSAISSIALFSISKATICSWSLKTKNIAMKHQ